MARIAFLMPPYRSHAAVHGALAALARALERSAQRDWPGAQDHAARSGPIAQDLIRWQRLRAGQGTWPEYLQFALSHRDWPGMALLYRRGDALLRPDLPPAQILAWFGDRRPETLPAAEALIADGHATAADFDLATDGYKPASAEFIDAIPFDPRQPNAYIDSLPIGLKGSQRVVGGEITN